MKISIKGYISPKEAELFYDCADRYAINQEKNKFAISDGVSKSFFPKVWAETLVRNWVENEWKSDVEYINTCQNDWLQTVTEIVNKPETKWFTKNAFNRKEAALATFVSLRFFKKKKEWFWKANALGDSFLFFVPSNWKDFEKDVLKLSSKIEPIVFDNFPDYLASIGTKHNGERQTSEKALSEGTFFLMTDALAEWFLNEQNNAIYKTAVWKSQTDFERFIVEERLSKLGNDDSAILIIHIEDDKKDDISYGSVNISDIDELIDKQQKELDRISNKKKQKENKLEISSEKVKENEPLENTNLKDSSKNIEKPNKIKKEGTDSETDNIKEEPDTTEKVNEENKTDKESVKPENKNSSQNNQTHLEDETEEIQKESSESKPPTPNKDSKNTINKF